MEKCDLKQFSEDKQENTLHDVGSDEREEEREESGVSQSNRESQDARAQNGGDGNEIKLNVQQRHFLYFFL